MRAARPLDDSRGAAVVIGLDCITGLQSARILARRGVPVVAIASDPHHFCCRTRAPRRLLRADTGSEELIEVLERLGPELTRRAVLFPCTDPSVLLLARHRARLTPWFHVVLPETDVLEMLLDKVRFHDFAQHTGLPVPRTCLLRSRADAERAAAELTFPCILKPPLRTPLWERHSKAKVYRVEDPAMLLSLYDRYARGADLLMAQQWIAGSDSELYSCNGYFDRRSQPLATFVARKLRQWPPGTGTSSLGEECRNDAVLDMTVRLFRASGFSGLGYLEVKRDSRSGEHFLIEANVGRPTGRSAIAEAGGVELLYTMYCDALGIPLPAARHQRYGNAKWISLRQDLRSAFYYWRRRELSLGQWAESWRGLKSDAVLSWTDPGPFLADLVQLTGKVVAGLRRRGEAAGTPGAAAAVSAPRSAGDLATGRVPAAAGRLGPTDAPHFVDYDLNGCIGIRLVGPSPADAAAVALQLGGVRRPLEREPDIVVRYLDRLPTRGLRFVEVNRSAFTDDGSFLLRGANGARWARIPFERIGGGLEIVCERGIHAVPLLKPLLRLTALGKGWVPVHGSAFEWQGVGVLVTGWSHGGKTSSLLAFAEHGARYVADDLVFLGAARGEMFGLPAPLHLSDWHLGQLPRARRWLRPRQRLALDGLRWLPRAGGRNEVDAGGTSGGMLRTAVERVRRRFKVRISPEVIFRSGSVPVVEPRKLFFVMSHRSPEITIEPADPGQLAERMLYSNLHEDLALWSQYLAFRFAFPGQRNALVESAQEIQQERLARALNGMEAYVVRHPYPVPLRALYEAMRPSCEPVEAVATACAESAR